MANWENIRTRGNVQDKRSYAPMIIGSVSAAGMILYVVVNLLFGNAPFDILQQLNDVPVVEQQGTSELFEGIDSYETFAATVLGSNNQLWEQIFAETGK